MDWCRLVLQYLFLSMLFIQGCQMDPCGSAPADLVENMEDLVKEVKNADYDVNSDQWQSYDDRFKVYFEDCYERWRPEMTFNQKQEFAGLVARYVSNRFGRSFFRSIFGKDHKMEEDAQEFFDELGGNWKKFIEENKEWGKGFMEEFGN